MCHRHTHSCIPSYAGFWLRRSISVSPTAKLAVRIALESPFGIYFLLPSHHRQLSEKKRDIRTISFSSVFYILMAERSICQSFRRKICIFVFEPLYQQIKKGSLTGIPLTHHRYAISILTYLQNRIYKSSILPEPSSGQALVRLVMVSSMHYCTSTSTLSTWSSLRGLTSFEWDISSWGGLHA